MRINKHPQEEIYKTIDKTTANINRIITEIEDTQKELQEMSKKEKITSSYFVCTSDSRLEEASVRLRMSLTRLKELREEADMRNLSESGFY